jgi:hypothetical protein
VVAKLFFVRILTGGKMPVLYASHGRGYFAGGAINWIESPAPQTRPIRDGIFDRLF